MHRFADLPVAVDLPPDLSRDVSAFVEAEAGWQVVDSGGPLVPALHLTATPSQDRRCVVIATAATPLPELRSALLGGAIDVITWPDERHRLLEAPARLPDETSSAHGPAVLRIAGARGGVGCSTVALAAAACVAWSGRRALIVCDSDALSLIGMSHWPGAGTAELAALGPQAAAEVAGVTKPVPGVEGLSVLGGGRDLAGVGGWPYDLVVVDAGTAAEGADVTVARADGAVAAAGDSTVVLVVEHGPLDRAGVRRRLGRRPTGWLPYSARVARAALAGRVPSALPGSWVKSVRCALAGAAR